MTICHSLNSTPTVHCPPTLCHDDDPIQRLFLKKQGLRTHCTHTHLMFTSILIFALAYLSLPVPWIHEQWAQLVETNGNSSYVTVFLPWVIGLAVYWAFGLAMLAVELKQYPRIIFDRKIEPTVALQTNGSLLQPLLLHFCRVVLFNQVAVMLPTLIAVVSRHFLRY